MRSITPLLGLGALTLTVGCATVDSDLQYLGTLQKDTNGVVMFEDGNSGHAAMSGTTCVITTSGGIEDDVDVTSTDNESVLDGTRDADGTTVLARTTGELHLLFPTDNIMNLDDDVRTVDVPGVQDARLTESRDIVALADCGVQWMNLDEEANLLDTSILALEGCSGMDPTFDVNPLDGTAFVTTTAGVVSVTPDGATRIADAADLLEYSVSQDALVLANAGDSVVRLVDSTGAELWSADVGAPVFDVADLGSRDLMGVMLDHDNGAELVLLNVADGSIDRTFSLPSAATIEPSGNGQTLALVLPNAVHYYNLR